MVLENKEKRKSKRYEISEYIKDNYFQEVSVEINTDVLFKPEIIDISMNGLGFAIKECDDSVNLDEFDKLNNFFINIYFFDKVILSEVKKIWSIIIEEEGNRVLKGGLVFSVMSPEDRLHLAEYFNNIRN